MAAMTWAAAVVLVIAMTTSAAAQTLAGRDLLAALRAGGYVIYFRHADTDHSRQDQPPVNLDDCATQRMLSEKGRQNSRAIGEAIRALDVPIGPVLASPLPEPAGSPGRYAALRALLSTAPPAGKNTAIVGTDIRTTR
jgi:hypothetical protein